MKIKLKLLYKYSVVYIKHTGPTFCVPNVKNSARTTPFFKYIISALFMAITATELQRPVRRRLGVEAAARH